MPSDFSLAISLSARNPEPPPRQICGAAALQEAGLGAERGCCCHGHGHIVTSAGVTWSISPGAGLCLAQRDLGGETGWGDKQNPTSNASYGNSFPEIAPAASGRGGPSSCSAASARTKPKSLQMLLQVLSHPDQV